MSLISLDTHLSTLNNFLFRGERWSWWCPKNNNFVELFYPINKWIYPLRVMLPKYNPGPGREKKTRHKKNKDMEWKEITFSHINFLMHLNSHTSCSVLLVLGSLLVLVDSKHLGGNKRNNKPTNMLFVRLGGFLCRTKKHYWNFSASLFYSLFC